MSTLMRFWIQIKCCIARDIAADVDAHTDLNTDDVAKTS
jgi:hypothetical protein